MNTIKPQALGLLPKVYDDAPHRWMSVGVLGHFDMRAPDTFLKDADMWPFVMGALPEGTVLDLAMPKVQAEILVYGRAMPKGGVPVTGMAVGFQIGTVRKTAVVHGDRVWRLGLAGLQATAPLPFTEMPVDYAHAFGGEGFARNPLGRGFDAEARTRSGELVSLPNVESREQPVVSARDRPEPVGFGGIDIAWPQRTSKAGTYDKNWERTRFPGLAADHDPTIHNAAAPDQWLDRWLEPGEAYAVGGMHPDHDVFRSHLPALRVRCFVNQRQEDGSEILLELALHAETAILFPSDMKGVMIYRGRIKAREFAADDITAVMLAYERLDDPPRSNAHYVEVFGLRTDPATKGLHGLNDLQLAPALSPEAQEERQAEREAYAAGQLAKQQRVSDRLMLAMLEKAGTPPGFTPPKVRAPSSFPVVTPQDIARGEVDLPGIMIGARGLVAQAEAHDSAMTALAHSRIADARAAVGRVSPAKAEMLAKLDAGMARADEVATQSREPAGSAMRGAVAATRQAATAPPTSPPPASDLTPAQTVDGIIKRLQAAAGGKTGQARDAVMQVVDEVRAAVDPARPAIVAPDRQATLARLGTGLDRAEAEALARMSGPARDDMLARVKAARGELAAASARVPALPKRAPAPPPLRPEERKQLVAAAKSLLGEALPEGRRSSPVPLAPEAPLAEADAQALRARASAGGSLAGLDFAGADLSHLDLQGIDLAGAFFEQADLTGADLRRAQLRGAVLTAATLAGARFDGCDLTGANLSAVAAQAASFAGADLSGILAFGADFTGADLGGTTWRKTVFQKASFAGASIVRSTMRQCVFLMSDFADASLDGADLERCTFVKTEMSRLRARDSRLYRCAITEGAADAVDFSGADVTRTTATALSFKGAVFRRMTMSRSGWMKVDLDGADFTRAVLDQAFVGMSTGRSASFYRASMRGAALMKCDLTGADLSEANLMSATIRGSKLDGAELRHACLYGANLDGTTWTMCDLTGANLRYTEFKRV